MTIGATIVVGGGVIGASIADQLARSGARDVVVCEQDQAGWTATAQSGGILRGHHTADCDIELAARSLPFFRNFEQRYARGCGYSRQGFALLVGPGQVDALQRNMRKLELAGIKAELLVPAQLQARFGKMRLDGIAAAAFEPECGYASPAATARELLASAESYGASVYRGVSVRELLVRGNRISGVGTNIGELAAATVVVANGAWSGQLAATAGVDLPVAPRRIALGFCRGPEDFSALPACIDDTLGNFFRPHREGIFFGVPIGPDEPSDRIPAQATAEEIDAGKRGLSRRLPALGSRPVTGSRLGVEGYAPDRRPLIGRIGPDGLYVATGMSGGGFKIAPAVGELVARELCEEDQHQLLAPYRPQRFAEGRPIVGEFPYQWM